MKSRDKPGVVPRPTGHKSLCLCAFFLPDDLTITAADSHAVRDPVCAGPQSIVISAFSSVGRKKRHVHNGSGARTGLTITHKKITELSEILLKPL